MTPSAFHAMKHYGEYCQFMRRRFCLWPTAIYKRLRGPVGWKEVLR
jgi:hypothetical protein